MITKAKFAASAHRTKDFWLLYPMSNQANTLSDALFALYYLPENYKLLILNNGYADQTMDMSAHQGLKHRIQHKTETEVTAQASPFSYDHALISDDATPEIVKQTIRSQIIVSKTARANLKKNKAFGFTVSSGNPPALASAALKLAQARI